MYLHTVAFNLNADADSAAETTFIDESRALLAEIPGVKNFTVNRQVSPKTDFRWQFSMEFDTTDDFLAYNDHPAHTAYVAERWIPEVATFQELDFVRHA